MTQEDYAQQIVQCYQAVQAKDSNVVYELFDKNTPIYERQHYPLGGDIRDKINHTQYYYHSHSSKNPDRLPEHGHFHCFIHKKALSNTAQPLACSKKYLDSDGKKDALCHVIAIAMNEYGLPTAIFTVNHWIVQGLWYKASDIIPSLIKYQVAIKDSKYKITNQWLTSMIQLFREPIEALLIKRDEVITDWQRQNPEKDVLKDEDLEVTSIFRFADVAEKATS